MAFPHPQGLLPSEVAFLCEMELITVIPRQRLERLDLLGALPEEQKSTNWVFSTIQGPTQALIPPQRSPLPLWLALLLKRQKRANVLAPPWLHPDSLRDILELETVHYQDSFSPPPQQPLSTSRTRDRGGNEANDPHAKTRLDYTGKPFHTAPPFTGNMLASAPGNALPYHWFELAEMLLDGAADDLVEPDTIRGLLRDLREVRLAKMRKGVDVLSGEGDGVQLDGVGAMEISESRGFITGVVDGLRKIGASREQTRREREEEEGGRYARGGGVEDDEDEDMT